MKTKTMQMKGHKPDCPCPACKGKLGKVKPTYQMGIRIPVQLKEKLEVIAKSKGQTLTELVLPALEKIN